MRESGSQLNSTFSWCSFQAACLALSSRHNSPAPLRTGFSPWKSLFSRLIWLVRRKRSVLLVEGMVLGDFLFSLGFCQIACLVRLLAFRYSSLLPLFFQVFQHLCLSFDCTADSRILPPGLFRHRCILVDPHTFSAAFSRLDIFSQVPSIPLPRALLEVVLVMKAYSVWASGSLRHRSLSEGRISCSWEGDVITKIPDQQVVLHGDLAKDNLAIPRMLVEGYTEVCTKSIWVLPSPEV